MFTAIVKWIISAFAIFLVGNFLPGLHIPDYRTALVIAFVFGFLNIIIRPILLLIAFPITVLTLGLFVFVINGALFWLALSFAHAQASFIPALIASIVVSLLTMILDRIFLGSDGKVGGT